jgi:hypothetical protein
MVSTLFRGFFLFFFLFFIFGGSKNGLQGAWLDGIGVIGTKCYSVVESAPKFWDVPETWINGVFRWGCAKIPFPFLELSIVQADL